MAFFSIFQGSRGPSPSGTITQMMASKQCLSICRRWSTLRLVALRSRRLSLYSDLREPCCDHRVHPPFTNERADATSLYLLSDVYTQRGLRRIREYIWPFEAVLLFTEEDCENRRGRLETLPYAGVEIERVECEMCPSKSAVFLSFIRKCILVRWFWRNFVQELYGFK